MGKFLIAGLGNPGSEYSGTRHNIGFDVADYLVFKHGGNFKMEKMAALAEIKIKGNVVFCIKPSTFMNLSGLAVKYWMDREKISRENIIILVDDLALPLSRLRLRGSGSDAGHNGLKSIQGVLGTDNYPKLRFGIGNDFPKGMQVAFVLGKWKSEDLPMVRLKIEKSVEIIESFVSIGIERTMNQYNKLEITI
jgi:peptidyl-tRNA hydrolase, PTH1 family